MNVYNLRINMRLFSQLENECLKAKIAFKTKTKSWLNTPDLVVIPLSIDTGFHQGIAGRLKMQALIKAIRENIKSRPTLLFTDGAHRHVHSQLFQSNLDRAVRDLSAQAKILQQWILPLASGCNIAFWTEVVLNAPEFGLAKKYLYSLLAHDSVLRALVEQDALQSYTALRQKQFRDKISYIESAKQDIMEYLSYQLVFSQKIFLWQLYPGKEYASSEYLQQRNIITMKSIYVFIAIESKNKPE